MLGVKRNDASPDSGRPMEKSAPPVFPPLRFGRPETRNILRCGENKGQRGPAQTTRRDAKLTFFRSSSNLSSATESNSCTRDKSPRRKSWAVEMSRRDESDIPRTAKRVVLVTHTSAPARPLPAPSRPTDLVFILEWSNAAVRSSLLKRTVWCPERYTSRQLELLAVPASRRERRTLNQKTCPSCADLRYAQVVMRF